MKEDIKKEDILAEDYLSRVSLLITTHNSYPFLIRLMRFYEIVSFPFKNVLILDSSSDPMPKEVNQFFAWPFVKHMRFPTEMFVTQKILEGLNKVSTAYVTLCADHDFLSPEGIAKSIEFLEHHKDYICAQGLFINHFPFGKRGDSPKPKFAWSPLYATARSVEENSSLDRLKQFMTPKVKRLFYAVYSTSMLRSFLNETNQYAANEAFYETLPLLLTLIHGKVKVLPHFYGSCEASKTLMARENAKEHDSHENIEKVIQCAANFLKEKAEISLEESIKTVRAKVEAAAKDKEERIRQTDSFVSPYIKLSYAMNLFINAKKEIGLIKKYVKTSSINPLAISKTQPSCVTK